MGPPGLSREQAAMTAVAVGRDGVPFVACLEQSGASVLGARVLSFSGGVWEAAGGQIPAAAGSLSLAIDASNKPYLAVEEPGSGRATVLGLSGGQWEALQERGFTPGPARHLSLGLTPDGTPVLAFADGSQGYKLSVYRYASCWSVVGTPGASSGEAQSVSLAISPAGTMYVAMKESLFGAALVQFNSTTNSWPLTVNPGGCDWVGGQGEFGGWLR